jgi:DNA gyrase/topoisomerase IV subunit B
MKRAVIALLFILSVGVINVVTYADTTPNAPTGAEITAVNSSMFSMEEYWLEQIYYQVNDLTLIVQQIRNQYNSLNLSMTHQLQETRNYHQNVLSFQNELRVIDGEITALNYWILALTAFQTALLVVIIFAISWGNR